MSKPKSRSNPTDIHVGQRVRMLRMAKGLSQEKLADQIGVTFQQVQKYEKGTNRIGAGRLRDIAMILGVSVTAVFDGLPNNPQETTELALLGQMASTREGVRVLTALSLMSDAHRRNVVILVENIAELLGR